MQLTNLQKAKAVVLSKEAKLNKRQEDIEHLHLYDQSTIDSLKKALENEKNEKKKLETQIKNNQKEEYINLKVKKWRRNSWIKCIICTVLMILCALYIFFLADWELSKFNTLVDNYKSNLIITVGVSVFLFLFTFYFARELREKYINNSNIKAYKEMIKVPDDLK